MKKSIAISRITGWPLSCFTLAGKDGYGTERPDRYHFCYRELAKHFGIKDKAVPGYSYDYPKKFYQAFELGMFQLSSEGYKIIDPIVLSHVHGFFSRTIS